MKSALLTFIIVTLCLLSLVIALQGSEKSIIVSFPATTRDDVVEKARYAIIEAGGMITHEYKLFKGFAATIPAKALDMIKGLTADFSGFVEEDQVISIQN